MSRVLIGLSVGSGLDGADAAAVRTAGVGLDLGPAVLKAVRVLFPPAARDQFKAGPSPELTRNVADTLVHAARTIMVLAGLPGRDVFAVGLLAPARAADAAVPWAEVADRVAEQTGFTVVHNFRGRDRAAGGTGQPITAAADALLVKSDAEDRVLVHLGAVTQLVFVPAKGKLTEVVAFEPGPGNQLLDAMVFHGTRGREATDPGGKKAVQGCCLEPLLARWLDHPHLTRKPPKSVHADAFGRSFLLAAFDAARQLGAGLPDLLCTTTHLIARAVATASRDWLAGTMNGPVTGTGASPVGQVSDPPASAPRAAGKPEPFPTNLPFRASCLRRVVLSGGGVRNGFLWQRLTAEFDGTPVVRTDEVGIPALGRSAAAAAVLAALTCDGVSGNLPVWTGAAGGRLIGQLVPGDTRNWSRLAAWAADQMTDTPRVTRAA